MVGKLLVRVRSMALPNLLLEQPVFEEYIQNDCSYDNLAKAMKKLYAAYNGKTYEYAQKMLLCQQLRELMMGEYVVQDKDKRTIRKQV
jgi:lipid A disaccharide synthetase